MKTDIYIGKKAEKLATALREFGEYPMRDESGYALTRAQRALAGRTHYVDDGTLRYFSARILRCVVSHHGFYCLIQESLAHPEMGRVRRNVLFDVFGSVVSWREIFHKSAVSADKEFSELCALMDSEFATAALAITLRENIKRTIDRANRAGSALKGV